MWRICVTLCAVILALPLVLAQIRSTPLSAFCNGVCKDPRQLYPTGDRKNFPGAPNRIPRSSPDGINPWPVSNACDGGYTYGVPARATWWDDYSNQQSLPTNSWFMNYYSSAPYSVNAQGLVWPVYQTPYTTQATADSFKMGIPTAQKFMSPPGGYAATVTPPVVQFGLTTLQFSFGTVDGFQNNKKISNFDPDGLGVTLKYTTNGGGSMVIPVMKGSPYITIMYSATTPSITYTGGDIKTVNGRNVLDSMSTTVNPTSLGNGLYVFDIVITYNDSPSYKYRLYSNVATPIQVTKPTPAGCKVLPWTIKFTQPCSSCVLRIACYSNAFQDPVVGVPFYTSQYSIDPAVLDQSANVYPVVAPAGSERSVTFKDRTFKTSFRMNFQWTTACMVSGVATCDPSKLLMLALPHHRDLLPVARLLTNIKYATMSGAAVGVLGDTWTMTYVDEEIVGDVLTGDPFQFKTQIDEPAKVSKILETLPADIAYWTGASSGPVWDGADCYLFGKFVSQLARLVLVADALGQATLAYQGRTALKDRLNQWLDPTSATKVFKSSMELTYDTTWGGLIPADAIGHPGGYWVQGDTQPQFGSGGYNDHLFHYGYYLYAIATVLHSGASADISWWNGIQDRALALARNIANPSPSEDPYFTGFRHKSDWFSGHSWASGMFPSGNSPNVESSSEGLNAWYSLYLLGHALNQIGSTSLGTNMMFVGRISAISDVHSFNFYSRTWLQSSKNLVPSLHFEVYPDDFAQLGIVGNLWAGQAIYQTFFGYGACEDASSPLTSSMPPACAMQRHVLTHDQVRYYNALMVLAIQIMPFTPFSLAVANRTWLHQAFFTPGLSFTMPDGSVSNGYTPQGKSNFFPDFFNRCANNMGCDSWLAYAWQLHAMTGAANRDAAWNEINLYGMFPLGATKTNTLFYIASQPN